jgi:hypothetical protein
MIKGSLIASIIIGSVATAASLSYLLNAPFPSAGWIVCAVIGAFAVITVEQI